MAAEPALTTPDIGAPLLALEVTPTLADHVEFNIYLRDRPLVRRRCILVMAAALLGGPPLGLVLGFLTGWATDPHGRTLAESLALIGPADWRQGLGVSLLVSGVLAAIAGVVHLFRRPFLRWRLRALLAERPGIDPADPALRSRVRVTLAERGFAVDGEGSHTVMAAASVKGVGRTRGALILLVSRMSGFIIPTRDLSREEVTRFEAITRDWAQASEPRSRG